MQMKLRSVVFFGWANIFIIQCFRVGERKDDLV